MDPYIEARRLLTKTFEPFFGRFPRLTKIQIITIPEIIKGKNVMVVSGAATGKTEAVLAPLLESILTQEKVSPFAILYIAPTRALLNDLQKRIKEPIQALGLKSSVRTGDRPNLPLKTPPHILLTTPESLDSLVCRYPHLWKNLGIIILDELHLLDGTYRGDQLRCLLQRLKRWHAQREFKYAALSATLKDPKATASRYFEPVKVIRDPNKRYIHIELCSGIEEAIYNLKAKKKHKALIFANTRLDVEDLALKLKSLWPSDRILVHHGSLSKKERESVEEVFRTWEWGLCISTMTLEIGIDIGDIEAVVLYGLPPSPSAFLQRIGRGSRKKQEIFSIGCFRTPEEQKEMTIFANLVKKGVIEEIIYSPDYSVCVQQIFSSLYGNPKGVLVEELKAITRPLCNEEICNRILEHLLDQTIIISSGKYLKASEKLMNMGERGIIHSNIPESGEYRIVDTTCGKFIGQAHIIAAYGSYIMLSGKVWKVIDIKKKNRLVYVEYISSLNQTGRAKFGKRGGYGAFYRYLPSDLTKIERG